MDFLEEFVKGTAHVTSPELFRTWAGVGAVASVLGRKVYTSVKPGLTLFGNQFICLVSKAAGGKSGAISEAHNLLRGHDAIHFSGDAPTPEALNQKMGEWFDGADDHNGRSFAMLAGEIGTFFMDPEKVWWFQELALLWDSGPQVTKFTKTQDDDIILMPYVNMLVGAQPAWFANGFPKNINNLGLPSRLIYVYSDEQVPVDLDAQPDAKGLENARQVLNRIARARGEVKFAPEAWKAWKDWIYGGLKPVPLIEGLGEGYLSRRNMHAGKLAMAMALSAHPRELMITKADLNRAFELLFRTERDMHKAMALAGGNIHLPKELAVVEYVRARHEETQQGVPEADVRVRLGKYFAANMRNQILDDLIQSKRLEPKITKQGRVFVPGVNA